MSRSGAGGPTSRRRVARPAQRRVRAVMVGWIAAALAGATALVACAPAAHPDSPAPSTPAGASAQSGIVAAGLGTLHQDEFTVELRSDALLLKATPLSESVIRLAAPDTYARLHALQAQASDRGSAVGGEDAELWLVSVFSYSTGAVFQPEDLQIEQQGRVYRGAGVIPLTAGWGRQQLEQRKVESAVYVFRGPLDYDAPLSVLYAGESGDAWARIIPALQAERARVRSRSGSTGQASMSYSLILR